MVSGVCRLVYDVQNFDAHILIILALVYLLSNAATHTSIPTLLLQSLVHWCSLHGLHASMCMPQQGGGGGGGGGGIHHELVSVLHVYLMLDEVGTNTSALQRVRSLRSCLMRQ